MAAVRRKTLKVAGAITIVGLLALLLPSVIVPLVPPLHPLTSQLLTRLREALAFLAFTTAIAVWIFSTQHKGVQHENQNKLFLENHPLGSIFGESEYEEVVPLYADHGKRSLSPSTRKNERSHGGSHGEDDQSFPLPRFSTAKNDGFSLSQSSETAMGASALTMVNDGNAREPPLWQRRLHRKSSSLDDSVNYEPDLKAPEASPVNHARTNSNEQGVFAGNKPAKRVSFSLASSPSSPKHATGESLSDLSEKTEFNPASPGDLTGQADAFIAKFKEQLRLQRLASFQRNQRRP